ncbi:MAG: hypothetical protein QM530_04215 [Phycisphaerales bacterium]|nr:hypothetical protein [Phycisphaerales bacterium]
MIFPAITLSFSELTRSITKPEHMKFMRYLARAIVSIYEQKDLSQINSSITIYVLYQ